MVKRQKQPETELHLKFTSTISCFGQGRKAINIPKKYHEKLDNYVGQDIVVEIKTV